MTETVQELYNRVLRGLWKQGGPSFRENTGVGFVGCAYRGDHGRKCAVGLIIPDESYTVHMEGMNIYQLMKDHPTALPIHLSPDHVRVLHKLQLMHDHQASVADGLKGWADDYDKFRCIFSGADNDETSELFADLKITFPTEEELNA